MGYVMFFSLLVRVAKLVFASIVLELDLEYRDATDGEGPRYFVEPLLVTTSACYLLYHSHSSSSRSLKLVALIHYIHSTGYLHSTYIPRCYLERISTQLH